MINILVLPMNKQEQRTLYNKSSPLYTRVLYYVIVVILTELPGATSLQ